MIILNHQKFTGVFGLRVWENTGLVI